MEKRYFNLERDGFYGVYYPSLVHGGKAMIAMLGDSSDDHMVKSGVKWLHKHGCNAMAMSPNQTGGGCHDYALEQIGRAIKFLKRQGNFVGAEDDVLWNTCEYIRRMMARLDALPHNCAAEALLYEHGTHFVFPQSMLKTMLPVGSGLLVRLMFRAGQQYPKECKETRLDIDEKLARSIAAW